MSILAGAEFVVTFYEKLPQYLALHNEGKAYAKDYKKLSSFFRKVKSSLNKIQDDISLHAAKEQTKFIDAMLVLASEYLEHGQETEICRTQKQTIEYALFVWSHLSPLPKKIKQLSLACEQANEGHYYSIEKLTQLLYMHQSISEFYIETFQSPFEKIKKASDGFRKQYIHLATARAQEGMAFATSMADSMKQMYHDYTLIYEFARLTNDTSKYAYVMLMNAMPSIVIEALDRPISPKEANALRSYVKWLEKQIKKQDWSKYLRLDIPLEELIAEERANDDLFDTPTPLDVDTTTLPEETPEIEEPVTEEPVTEEPVSVTTEETAMPELIETTEETTTVETTEELTPTEQTEETPLTEMAEEPVPTEPIEETTVSELPEECTTTEETEEIIVETPEQTATEPTGEVDFEVELLEEVEELSPEG